MTRTTTLALLLLSITSGSWAATITVDTVSDDNQLDGVCSLREAIIAANLDSAQNDCPKGLAADRIVFDLPPSSEIPLLAPLPVVTESVVIRGPDDASLTINGQTDHAIWKVNSPGNDQWVGLENLRLAQGNSDFGGALRVSPGDTVRAVRLHLFQNQAESGGAVFLESGATARFERCVFEDNTSVGPAGGGAIGMAPSALVEIVDSTLMGNRALGNGSGGAVRLRSADLLVERSTLSGNQANSSGGGIRALATTAEPLTLAIIDSTLTLNIAGAEGDTGALGGGLRLSLGTTSSATVGLHNSIVAGNLDDDGAPDVYMGGVSPEQLSLTTGSNLIGQDGFASSAFFPPGDPNADGNFVGTNATPLLAYLEPLADAGGSTPTHPPIVGAGPTRVVDHGQCPATVADQRGFGNTTLGTRASDNTTVADHASSDGCDIGAVELDGDAGAQAAIFADGFELGHTLLWSAEVR